MAALGEGQVLGRPVGSGEAPPDREGPTRSTDLPGPAAVRAVVREPVVDPPPAPVIVEPLRGAASGAPGEDPPAADSAGLGPGPLPGVAVLEPDGRRVTWSIVEAGPERVRAIRSAAAGRGGEATAGEATAEPTRIAALLGPVRREADGRAIREVVVDGWRFGVEVEGARRAIVRERARRAGGAAHHGGPTEVRAAIPGRVVAVAVAEGDAVVVGSDLLVVEAMKMQNEVRSPRDGVVRRVAVGVGQSLELGDLLVVIE
jgi:biotin carboxyl carrier protein